MHNEIKDVHCTDRAIVEKPRWKINKPGLFDKVSEGEVPQTRHKFVG